VLQKIHSNHKPRTCLFFRRIHEGTHSGSGSKRDCGASRHTCPKGCIAGDNFRGDCRRCNAECKPGCRVTSHCNSIATCSKVKTAGHNDCARLPVWQIAYPMGPATVGPVVRRRMATVIDLNFILRMLDGNQWQRLDCMRW
jgi:hypothetical protein